MKVTSAESNRLTTTRPRRGTPLGRRPVRPPLSGPAHRFSRWIFGWLAILAVVFASSNALASESELLRIITHNTIQIVRGPGATTGSSRVATDGTHPGVPPDPVCANQKCGICQAAVYYEAERVGVRAYTHNVAELFPGGKDGVRHAFGIVEIEGHLYLIDVTGSQYHPDNPYYRHDTGDLPSARANRSPMHAAIWDDIMAARPIKITPENIGVIADLYGGTGAKVPTPDELRQHSQEVDFEPDEYHDRLRGKTQNLRDVPCDCFVQGTPVGTDGGDKPIEKVRAGDRVWAVGEEGELELRRVVGTKADPPRPTRYVKLRRGERIERLETTDEHPFFVRGLGWLPAAKLQAGQVVASRDGAEVKVVSSQSAGRRRTTYNFEVEGAHNYFVGKSEVLVHNVCATRRGGVAADVPPAKSRLRLPPSGGAVAGLLAGYLASYAGQSLGGDVGAMGAAFGTDVAMGLLSGQSMRLSLGSAGASVGVGFLTSWALHKAGVENPWIHTGAGIATGSLVEGAIAYGTWTTAAGGTAAGAAGSAMLSAGLWGVLAAEVTYHASQWYEIYQLNRNAANGDEAAQDALNEITFGGVLSPYSPNTYLLYGAYSWVTRPGDVLRDLWHHGL